MVARQRKPDRQAFEEFESRLRAELLKHMEDDSWQCEQDRRELEAHRTGRLDEDRRTFAPWLDAVCGLDGSRVLEIGSGSGSSTVALAEQGAAVTGIDVNADWLPVAEGRCEAYGVEAEFHHLNAQQAAERFAGQSFDLVLLFASLEHMTHGERLASLAGAWSLLPAGGHLAVVETPNRLWHFDSHTSLLPFFYWLPDDLAQSYSRHSPRDGFRQRHQHADSSDMESFLREGRGVSYHEFELALGIAAAELPVASSLSTHHRLLDRLRRLRRPRSLDAQFHACLCRARPDLHRGFLQPSLDLVLRKS